MVTFRAIGDWAPGTVHLFPHADTRLRIPALEPEIERAWIDARARLGTRLFDGPMCRLERFDATDASLRLWISPTSYKPFLGTNLARADAPRPEVPREALANPLGLSAALLTADGWILLGRRNASVAYYPQRVHPFAGSLEPGDADVFAAVARELGEELGLAASELAELRCAGLIEDEALRQPELIFAARCTRSRGRIEATLDAAEHHACVAIENAPNSIEAALDDPALTPVCAGALMLWGRIAFGQDWFAAQRRAIAPG